MAESALVTFAKIVVSWLRDTIEDRFVHDSPGIPPEVGRPIEPKPLDEVEARD